MATRSRARGATRRAAPKKRQSKLAKAKAIVAAMVGGTAKRSLAVQRAVLNQGISMRTYRTARKQLRVKAIRRSKENTRRGLGVWYAGKGRR